ncbi:putative membrane protein [Novosphingobium sp. SG751A]|uniref:SRPBCC family protein n=1 Tax=Novosphingobium sp. SG751A TaxID=2587000 RepID=UPI00155816B7|nr:SRPBCC family protein [Novosphingobium sp. SG751A]NOW46375.1 putative membrane protein [Novosphingobium sp. SG751A]
MSASEKDDAPVTSSRDIEPDRELFAETVTIARSRGELYAFWRDLTNVAPIVGPIVSIVPLDGDHARWTIEGPAGLRASWISVISEDRPGNTIFWQAMPGGDVENGGRIDFVDAGARGTILRMTMAFELSAKTGGRVAILHPGPLVRSHVRRILRSFKQMMEAREIATAARHRRLLNELPQQSGGQW